MTWIMDMMVSGWAHLTDWYWASGQYALRWLVVGVIGTLVLRRVIGFRLLAFLTPVRGADPREQIKRLHTLATVLSSTGVIILWMVIGGLLLQALGMSVGTVIASAGIAGLAIGLGAQSIVRDVIAGTFILIENHYNIGDVVDVAGVSGQVEEINLRTTVLRDLQGRVHIVPNGQIAVVTNRTKLWAQVVMDTVIDPSEDIDQAIELIKEVGQQLLQNNTFKDAVLADPKVLGVVEVSKTQIVIRTLIKTLPAKQWTVERIVRKKIKQAFDHAKIKTVT